MTGNPSPPAPGVPPAGLPGRFWDAESGALRLDALIEEFLAMERSLSEAAAPAVPAAGLPEAPEGYCIDCAHGLFEPDPEVNARLHAAAFTPEQAQLLYDLAAERLAPMIRDIAAGMAAERDMERLVAHFGGEEGWREISRQLLAWAKKNLPADAVDALSTSYEGVLALHRLMGAQEPSALRSGMPPAEAESEGELHRMMRDPRYWRDRDPSLVARVTEGFRRLYPDRGGRG
jgi:hypothetical protein